MPTGLDRFAQRVDPLRIDMPRVPLACGLTLEQHLERRAAVHLDEAGAQSCNPLLATPDEVRLEHEAGAGGHRLLRDRKHREVGRFAEPLRPREVTGAEPVEERLLDRVLSNQRQT